MHFLYRSVFVTITLVSWAGYTYSKESKADIATCNLEVDAEKYGFKTDETVKQDPSGCTRIFLTKHADDYIDKVSVAISVFDGNIEKALKNYPSRFTLDKNNKIKFIMPKPVSDPRTLYYLRPIKRLSFIEKTLPSGKLYIAEYKQKVTRLKKISPTVEEEVDEIQRCTHGLKQTTSRTIMASGCVMQNEGKTFNSRVFDLMSNME